MFDTPAILNLHLFSWVSYIARRMSCRHYAAEDREFVAVTPLAVARRQNCRKRHFGVYNLLLRKMDKVQKMEAVNIGSLFIVL